MPDQRHDYDALPTDKQAPSLRQELRVVAVVVIFVLTLEIIARIIAPNLERDRRHIHDIPKIVQTMDEDAQQSGNKKVVFFGNSLLMHGLREPILHQQLKNEHDTEIVSCKIIPNGTAMLDWVYLYKKTFTATNSHPDIIVVGFVSHHIHDQEGIKLRRLARHFMTTPDLQTLWDNDLQGFHLKTQSVLAHISALAGDQPEHQLGILKSIVPEYYSGVNLNNELVLAARQRSAKNDHQGNASKTETYDRMKRFILECKKNDVEVWFVPMPQPESWDFNPAAESLAHEHGMKILDARNIPGMTPEDFFDGYHLGDTGAKKFTHWMAAEIKKNLK